VVDENNQITNQFINLDKEMLNKRGYLEEKKNEFAEENEPIPIPIAKGIVHKVYYGESSVLKQLRYYPFVVLGVVALFILVSYFAFSFSRRAEENQIWVGLAKETAHQLGTPISSLMGWVDVIEMGEMPENASDEMRKDIRRLQIITERFSKIGSEPILKKVELNEALTQSVDYMKTRSGKRVNFEINTTQPVFAMLNQNLFDWVIENLTKNSIDAMEGQGDLKYTIQKKAGRVVLDISDTGKGIHFQTRIHHKKKGLGLRAFLGQADYQRLPPGADFCSGKLP